jgi:hypothetical protein
VGYGLPWWLDTVRYLTADETRALGDQLARTTVHALCPACHKRPATDKAHIARKGMGGQRQGGPMVPLCRACHTGDGGVDRCADVTLAVERLPVTTLPLYPSPAHRVWLVPRDGRPAFLGYVLPR